MSTKKYILPVTGVTKCEMIHALMVFSEPKAATDDGPGLAPKRNVF